MKALTVRQPYADAIAHGLKRIENRGRALPAKYVDVPVLLHAAKERHATRITAADLADIVGDPMGQPWPDLRSHILAVIRFAGSHRCDSSQHWCCRPWGQIETTQSPKVWHWEISEVTRLETPVSASGALGFWTPDDDDLAAVQRQIGLARSSA